MEIYGFLADLSGINLLGGGMSQPLNIKRLKRKVPIAKK